jgi:SAM-dependent methyltransferase
MTQSDSTAQAWDLAASVYADEVDADVALLRAGRHRFLPLEMPYLSELATWCRRAVHLQCSHGFEALALWRLGVHDVVGLDRSPAMLAQARAKATALHARATWIEADILAPQPQWEGSADLVYTGKGALPWVRDLSQWAARCRDWLKPGGRFLLVEAHPLNWMWVQDDTGPVLRPATTYFETAPRANADFPGLALARLTPHGTTPPVAWEHHWTLGSIVSALCQAGLILDELREDPAPFWNQFPAWQPDLAGRLPLSFALWMHRPGHLTTA